MNEANDQNEVVLANLPAGPTERRIALVIGLVLLAIGVVTVPFGTVRFQGSNARPAVLFSLTFLADLITWFLLISQFRIVRSRALLVLPSGYLFTSVMNIPQILTMRGQFSPTGLLGAGLQTGLWLALADVTGYRAPEKTGWTNRSFDIFLTNPRKRGYKTPKNSETS